MARTTGPVCRMCRREGMKLFLKGVRCDTDKCAVTRRQNPPGMHTFRRGKLTDYGVHLREKQKVKHYYGVLERQFRQYFEQAQKAKNTGDALLAILESRLDNVVHRLGFASSRSQARQMIRHGHVTVNGRKLSIPSYLVRAGDVISVKPQPKLLEMVQGNLAEGKREVPEFLALVPGAQPEGHVVRVPGVEDVSIPVQVQLILELLSR